MKSDKKLHYLTWVYIRLYSLQTLRLLPFRSHHVIPCIQLRTVIEGSNKLPDMGIQGDTREYKLSVEYKIVWQDIAMPSFTMAYHFENICDIGRKRQQKLQITK